MFILEYTVSPGSHSFYIFDNVPPDCSGEDLSFLLDSKGPAQQQYPETYAEPQKEHLHRSKGNHLIMYIFLSIILNHNADKYFNDYKHFCVYF